MSYTALVLRYVMGIGREIGEQVKYWSSSGDLINLPPHALANRLIDAAGSSLRLRGPLHALGLDPLFQQLLKETRPAKSRTLLQSLTSELAELYTPSILAELSDLLAAASGLVISQSTPSERKTLTASGLALAYAYWCTSIWRLVYTFRQLAPGFALAASYSLVLAWFGGELERVLFKNLGWSSGTVLLLILVFLQLLTRWGILPWRSLSLLNRSSAVDSRQAWRWVAAPWVHASDKEALINIFTMGIMICSTPLSLPDLVLRYSLTSLTCIGIAVQCSRWCHIRRMWGGASGFTAMLVSFNATLSLLHWQEFNFNLGPMRVPAWVLLWSYIAIQLARTMPRQHAGDRAGAWQRVACSPWAWGLPLGVIFGSVNWLQAILYR